MRVEECVGDEFGERGLEAALAASRATRLWRDRQLRQPVNRECSRHPSPMNPDGKKVGMVVHAENIANFTGAARTYRIINAHTRAFLAKDSHQLWTQKLKQSFPDPHGSQ